MARSRSFDTGFAGRVSAVVESDVVFIYTRANALGGWRRDRFNDGTFGAQWMREWDRSHEPTARYPLDDVVLIELLGGVHRRHNTVEFADGWHFCSCKITVSWLPLRPGF